MKGTSVCYQLMTPEYCRLNYDSLFLSCLVTDCLVRLPATHLLNHSTNYLRFRLAVL